MWARIQTVRRSLLRCTFCVREFSRLPATRFFLLLPPDAVALRYTWRQSRALVDGFWKRWSRDYVAALQARPKWRKEEKNLEVGDIVMLVDEQCRRSDWRTGRIVSTDGDELVRTVSVRTNDGKVFLRDRTKVVRLELDLERADCA